MSTKPLRRDKYLTVLASEVEALANMFVNQWPPKKMLGHRQGKWQFRFPVEQVPTCCRLLSVESVQGPESLPATVATFGTPDGQTREIVCPVKVGELLYLDEPCTILEIDGDVIHLKRDADATFRTVRDAALAKQWKGLANKPAPRPLPQRLAREERLRVREIRAQLLSAMLGSDFEAEGAALSNLAGRGNYLPNATHRTGFEWGIWADKFPKLSGRDAWAWVLCVERFWP